MVHPELFEAICREVETTCDGLTAICTRLGTNRQEFYRRMWHDSAYRDRFDAAKERQAENIADDIIDISDNLTGDYNRDRLRVDARKWTLAHLKPKKYGDKMDLTSGGDKLPTPPSELTVRIVGNAAS